LPYYKDNANGVVLTQTNAILYYIADKNGMCGSSPSARANTIMLVEGLRDWINAFFDVTYCNAPWCEIQDDVHKEGEEQALILSPRFKLLSTTYLEDTLPRHLKIYADILLKTDGQWLTGDTLTYADFVLYEYLDQHCIFCDSCLDTFPPLLEFMASFVALPKIQAYLDSEEFKAEPLHNRYSQFHRGWVVR
jgi:glutathione S-transferase